MKAGVSTVPRVKVMRPRRAVPSVERSSNRIDFVIAAKAGIHVWGSWRKSKWVPAFAGTTKTGPDQHRIAVRKKAIALPHRVTIRREHRLAPRKRRDEHQQGRFRQMEVRDQRIDARDPIA